MLMLLLSVPPS